MPKKELQDIEYAKFKEFIYEIYLRNIDEPDKNIIDEQRIIVHNKFHNPELDKIYDNTISFPYDVELFNYLLGMKLSPENMEHAASEFNISMELLIAKIKEYSIYPINNINGLELINKDLVLKLSKLYARHKEEKTNKSVDLLVI